MLITFGLQTAECDFVRPSLIVEVRRSDTNATSGVSFILTLLNLQVAET